MERSTVHEHVDLLTAARRRWPVILGCLMLGLGGATWLTSLHVPIYEAQAELFVGSVDVPAEAVAGYAVATDEVAETYAQLAESTEVVAAAAEAAGVTPEVLASDVAATAVPESPLIRVTASNADAEVAQGMAGAVAAALEDFVETSRSAEGGDEDLRTELVDVSRRLERARLKRSRLQRDLGAADSDGLTDDVKDIENTLTKTAGQIALLELEQQALQDRIVSSRANTEAQLTLRTVTDAQVTGSDTASVMRNTFAAGALIGLVLGVGLAVGLELRLLRKRATPRSRPIVDRPPAVPTATNGRNGTNGSDSEWGPVQSHPRAGRRGRVTQRDTPDRW